MLRTAKFLKWSKKRIRSQRPQNLVSNIIEQLRKKLNNKIYYTNINNYFYYNIYMNVTQDRWRTYIAWNMYMIVQVSLIILLKFMNSNNFFYSSKYW